MNKNKEINEKQAFEEFKKAGFNWESFNNGMQWRISGIDFYPTTHKWFDQKNEFKGYGIESFIKYIKSRQHKKEKGIKILSSDDLFEIAKRVKPQSLNSICDAIHKEIYG